MTTSNAIGDEIVYADLTDAVNAEVYRAATNRSEVMRRRERAEAQKGPVPWPAQKRRRSRNREAG